MLSCTAADSRKDIVFVVVDTLRRDHVSAYGADVETPTMQRLADEGQVFTNVEASFHQTTMSMGALFTGRTPSLEAKETNKPLAWNGRNWCGLARFAEGPEDSCVPQALSTLAEELRAVGYWTAGFVSNGLLFEPAGYAQGFEKWLEVSDKRVLPTEMLVTARSAPRVNDAVEKGLKDRPRDRPAFVYIHYLDVHDWHLHDNVEEQVLDGSYPRAVARFDERLAELLDVLEERGLRDHAVLFLTSDHGENLDEEHGVYPTHTHTGNPSFQEVLEIPLIVSPAVFTGTDRLLRSRDLGRLIREVAGLPAERPDEERILEPDEFFLSEKRFVTYRRGRYKSAFEREVIGKWGLFDLEQDPGETVNLFSVHPEISSLHLARAQEIAGQMEAGRPARQELTEEDRARLWALGYLAEENAARENAVSTESPRPSPSGRPRRP